MMKLSELDIYCKLLPDRLTDQELKDLDYPRKDPWNPTFRLPMVKGRRIPLSDKFSSSYTCERCKKCFQVKENGRPKPAGECQSTYHPGPRSRKGNCRVCLQNWTTAGCCIQILSHVHKGENLLANYMGYVETQPRVSEEADKLLICALGCELVWTTYGLELVKVTVVNYLGDVVYDQVVRPNNRVLDYNIGINQSSKADIHEARTSLRKVQRDLLDLISDTTIIIGYNLADIMKALKIFHRYLVDTSVLYEEGSKQRSSLDAVMLDVLGQRIEPKPRSCVIEARACLRLARDGL